MLLFLTSGLPVCNKHGEESSKEEIRAQSLENSQFISTAPIQEGMYGIDLHVCTSLFK